MKKVPELLEETSLDPADWAAFKQLGHRMLDDMFHYLQTSRERPAWQKPPVEAIDGMQQPLPQQPADPAMVYDQFLNHILPYNTENAHPRFWSWVQGGGTPLGMLADMLASGMNTNVSIGDHMPMYVEKQVIDWSKEMMGFPATAGGILLSGASLANITALVVARNHFQEQVRKKGLQAVPAQMMMYGSAETHNCVIKGVEVIGIGSDNFRKVPVDDQYQVRVDLMRQQIREDRAAGLLPFCIVGNAGTVNTGSIDSLHELAALAREEGLWFHVDGAFGAVPKILPEFDDRLKGIEQADSLSFDYHKWLYVNYEVACVLIRDAAIHRAAFASNVTYLVPHERGLSGGPDPMSNYGMELSRGFKALKVWMSIKEHGLDRYRQMIRQNLRQAQYLAGLIKVTPGLELMGPVPLNIVCFRYNPGGLTNEALNQLNQEILMRLHEQGIAAPSYTVLQGNYAIRAAITNHRSRMDDFNVLVEAVQRIGSSVPS
ncbi:pyridoxal phosphate-dependent decarboxylase family protein [Paraflavitalea pollutisoli]|uniref:pyridoxal phosphate-dependent decarboxylase family protein n=1 Tax=Paraflavitalea pollutisoli TaxID=3034143 RepID=UPI0023EB061C|nr:pyridoxal-dependent decarboxylase [Paraflavitalea sp. H1-2-19X]